jgi:hypothetical protein
MHGSTQLDRFKRWKVSRESSGLLAGLYQSTSTPLRQFVHPPIPLPSPMFFLIMRKKTKSQPYWFNVETVTYKNVKFNVWVHPSPPLLWIHRELINRMLGDRTKFDLCGDIIILVHKYVDHLSLSIPLSAKEAQAKRQS